jgi:hypothetical protein
MGAGQSARSGAAASEGRLKGAIAVSNMARWKPGRRTTHVQVSKDGDVLAIHNERPLRPQKVLMGREHKDRGGKAGSRAQVRGGLRAERRHGHDPQRLIYVPAGAPPSGAKGDPFADFNALDYYKEDAKFLASDF